MGAPALPENKVRKHEIKLRLNDEEKALAEVFESETETVRAEEARNLYMSKVRAYLASRNCKDITYRS